MVKFVEIDITGHTFDFSALGQAYADSVGAPRNPHNLSPDDVRYEYCNTPNVDFEKTLVCRTQYNVVEPSPSGGLDRIKYYLTKEQAADFCGVCEKTIQRRINPSSFAKNKFKLKINLYADDVVLALKEELDKEREEQAELEKEKAEKVLAKALAEAESKKQAAEEAEQKAREVLKQLQK